MAGRPSAPPPSLVSRGGGEDQAALPLLLVGLEGRPEPPPSCPHRPGPASQAGAAQIGGGTLPSGAGPGPLLCLVAEGRPPGSHVFRTRQQSTLAESKGNEQPAQLQTLASPHPHLSPEEAADPERAAQKEKLHEELKRVLQRKGESRRSTEETVGNEEEKEPLPPPLTPTSEMEAKVSAMEKTIETSELLEIIVETEAEAGVSGMSVAGGGKEGLFIKDVLKDSPAARALSLKEGDQLLSARVYFDNIKYEDALQILKCAEPYKISFCLKRTVPSTDVSRKPGTSTFEVKGPKAKMAKLNIQSLSSLKKKRKKKVAKGLAKDLQEPTDLAGGKLEIAPVDVEFSLPKFSKLRKAKSAGEVAVAEPSPDLSPRLSSLETKRRKLKFPRLKVKEAAAAVAAGGAKVEGPESRLEVGLPKVAVEVKAATKKEAEGKVSRFTVPFTKAKKAKEEAGGKVEAGFQAPQVELDFPLLQVGAGGESPKAGAKGEGFKIQAPQIGLPKMDVVLPKVSTVGMEVPEGDLQTGLKLCTAEVAAPKVDIDLSFPKPEGTPPPEVVPKGEGFRIKVPKFGVSAEEAKLKVPSGKVPALEVTLEKDKVKSKDLEEKLKVTVPSLDVEAPSVDLELPLPKGKAEAEVPKPRVEVPGVSVKIPSISLGKVVSKAQEGESKLPQVELGVGKPESPKTKAKGPKIQIPGFGISLAEHKSESKETAATVAAESKVTFPGLKMPSLDISVPKVNDVQLPKATRELAAPFERAKSQEAAEGPGFRFQMPQVSLPKFDLPAKAPPSPPLQIHTKFPKPEGDVGMKVSVPKVDLALPDVQLPKTPCQKPELDVAVEKPKVEVAIPSARLSFPSGAVPALDIDLPKVEVGLDLPKVERELTVSERLAPRDHEIKLKLPTFEAVSKDLEVELSVPTCRPDQPELEPSTRTFEGPDVSGMVAKIPKVDLALGKELPAAEGEQGLEIGLDLKAKPLPKISLEREGLAVGGKMKLPSVEIPAVTVPGVTVESSKVLEVEAKQKSSRFALPKFSISGPKVWRASPEASAPELEVPEAADKGSKLKMPKFGITFPKSKWGAEVESPKLALSVEGKSPKEKSGAIFEPQVGLDSSESRMKLPTMEVEVPSVTVDIGLPIGKTEEWAHEEAAGPSPEVGIDLPDVKLQVPKFSLPKFGGKVKEGELELKSREAKITEKEAKAKVSKFKMPSFSMMRRDVEVSGLEAEAKIKKGSGSPKEKGPSVKMPSVKMPTLQLSSPKLETDKGQLKLQAPELEVKVPQVELPRLSTKEGKAEAGLLVGSESPTFKVKMPSLEIAMPSPRAEGELEKPVVDVSEADIRGYEGELKIPSMPSIGISAPKVELDVGLPTAGTAESIPHGTAGADAKIKLPKVELPKFGRGEDGGMVEAGVQLLGPKHRREGEKEVEGIAEGSILGSKVRVPKVDISLPKARLSDAELPLTEGDGMAEGAEGKFKMPSVGLPKFSTPKMKAPEVELDMSLEAAGKMPKVKVSSPAIKLPKFGGSSSDGEGEAEVDLPRVPQLELKAPKLRGSAEMLSLEPGTKEAKIKMPSLPIGFGLGKAEADTGLGADDNKFKLKLPSLSISKSGTESSTDTQPLCPPTEGVDFSFKMPQIALPGVGFSVESEGKKEVKEESGKLAGMADLEVDVGGFEGRLKMPKIKMPTFGSPGPKEDTDAGRASPLRHRRGSGGGDLGEKKAAFKVPGLEISAPSIKAHAEYEVEEIQLRHGGSQELEGASKRGRTGSNGRKSPAGKGEGADADVEKKYKVKIPKFGLSLPKAGSESEEGIPGQEGETKAKKSMFALGRPKAKGHEGSSGLLEGEEEADGKGMMAKLKIRPTFGLSLSKPKLGLEVNGDLEETSSKLKVPKLGFSTSEESAQLNGEQAKASLQNGAQESKGKMGKIRLPQVELSSPPKMADTDPELNLKLVRAEEAKEDTHGSGGGSSGTFAALKASKFKSPKITFSGFKKRNGEAASGAVVSSSARTEMASLETGDVGAKGERSPKFRFPKLALSPKSHGVLEITSEHPEDEGGLKIKLPTVGFSGELGSEEPGLEAGLGPVRVVTKPEGGAAAPV